MHWYTLHTESFFNEYIWSLHLHTTRRSTFIEHLILILRVIHVDVAHYTIMHVNCESTHRGP